MDFFGLFFIGSFAILLLTLMLIASRGHWF